MGKSKDKVLIFLVIGVAVCVAFSFLAMDYLSQKWIKEHRPFKLVIDAPLPIKEPLYYNLDDPNTIYVKEGDQFKEVVINGG